MKVASAAILVPFICACGLFLLPSCRKGEHAMMIEELRKSGQRSGTIEHTESHSEYPNMKGVWIEYPTESKHPVVLEALESETDSLFRFYVATRDKTPLPNYGNPHIMMDVPPEAVEAIVAGGTAKGRSIEAMIKAAQDHDWKPITQGSHEIKPPVVIVYDDESNDAQTGQR